VGSEPYLFSHFHHFTAEPQRLPRGVVSFYSDGVTRDRRIGSMSQSCRIQRQRLESLLRDSLIFHCSKMLPPPPDPKILILLLMLSETC
jgi:hypothetical protein